MARGYWIARIDVNNMDGYKEYVAQNGAVFNKYGAKFLVRGGRFVGQEGSSRSRNVVLEFKDYETALACYNSPEYVALVALRSPHAESDLIIIEGYDGRLMVGDKIDTEPGNMSGPTYTGVTSILADCTDDTICTATDFQPDCPRLITIVIVDSMAVNGRKTVTIKGFASFFLTSVEGEGRSSIVHGTFVRSLTAGEIGVGQSDYGLYGVKLIQ